jgi:hypothetical protein
MDHSNTGISSSSPTRVMDVCRLLTVLRCPASCHCPRVVGHTECLKWFMVSQVNSELWKRSHGIIRDSRRRRRRRRRCVRIQNTRPFYVITCVRRKVVVLWDLVFSNGYRGLFPWGVKLTANLLLVPRKMTKILVSLPYKIHHSNYVRCPFTMVSALQSTRSGPN